ncbi:MAG: hypothetical protein JWL90_323 [Chthoniobacteraceae bacterium]|nr:hypothetical protein [Chthoniobacteraceae bacterium]
MTPTPDIPRGALDINYNSSGSFPNVELHGRSSLFYQESSYSHFRLFGVLFLAAAVISLLPWQAVAYGGLKLKYWIAIGCAWGGICGLAPYFIRNALGQTIIVDPRGKTLRIKSSGVEQTIAWQEIIAVQICHQEVSGDLEMSGWQLNLVWRDSHGIIKRHCLFKNANKEFVKSLGQRYELLFGFSYIDESLSSQTEGG